jgi:hypothetical protein
VAGSSEDWVAKRKSELRRHRTALVAFLAILAGLIALLLAPDIDTRQDASDQSGFFIGGVAILAIVLGAYAVFVATDRAKAGAYLNASAVFFAITGLIAAVCGLLTLPLGVYQFAFAVMVAALLHGVITTARLLIGR